MRSGYAIDICGILYRPNGFIQPTCGAFIFNLSALHTVAKPSHIKRLKVCKIVDDKSESFARIEPHPQLCLCLAKFSQSPR